MKKLSSPLQGLDQRKTDNVSASNGGLLKKLPTGLPDRRQDRILSNDPLDSHINLPGSDRPDMTNKVEEDLKIPKRDEDQYTGEDSIIDDLRLFVPPTIRDYNTLMSFMHNHVVELRFTRRRNSGRGSLSNQRAGQSRRMLCTANWKFLSSMFTRWVFNWKTPKTRRGASWYKQRNLIIVWDLISKDFRIMPTTDIRFISAYKCTSLTEKGRFILFYRKNIGKLTNTQITKYFNA
jgi:hypothetical protein